MTITEIINDYKSKRKKTARLFTRYQELKEKAAAPTSAGDFSEVKTKSTGGRENLYIKMINAREKWQAATLDELEARQKLFDLIMEIENQDESDVLYYRFVLCMKHREIINLCKSGTAGLCLSPRRIFYKIKSGIKHLETIAAKEDPEE